MRIVQQDLFKPRPLCGDLPLSLRMKAMELLKALLTEATADPAVEIGASTKARVERSSRD